MKIFSSSFNKFVDRELEKRLLRIASEKSLGPKLLFSSDYGFCTRYVESFQLSGSDLTRIKAVSNLVATQLGKFNACTACNLFSKVNLIYRKQKSPKSNIKRK